MQRFRLIIWPWMTISRVLHDIKNNKSERIKFKFVKLTGVFFLFESGMHNQIYLAQTNKRHTHKKREDFNRWWWKRKTNNIYIKLYQKYTRIMNMSARFICITCVCVCVCVVSFVMYSHAKRRKNKKIKGGERNKMRTGRLLFKVA